MNPETHRWLHGRARRLCRCPADADDLVQETLLAGWVCGREDPAWLSGVMRRQAALAGRTAIRRRQREMAAARLATSSEPEPQAGNGSVDPPRLAHMLRRLPPAARTVAVLALQGLSGEEIRCLLGLSSTAFRQRLTSVRTSLASWPRGQREQVALAGRWPIRSVDLPFGLVRRSLKAALGTRGQALGSHDPDGHLLVVRVAAHGSASGGNR